MDKKIKDILAAGLGQGFIGKSIRGQVKRAGFSLDTSDYKGAEGRYHDEWAAQKNGAGQELVETLNGEKASRVYAGGTLNKEGLDKLGVTDKDVIGKLIFFVNQLGEKTRLDSDTESSDGDWTYAYKILEEISEIPLVVGKEEIKYKGKLVFVHFHINSPVV